ncbi:unnamed protein product [Caenorhabditis angaria]|uniref:Uncharacterized protein n=1 Tax=Caenorhabditis angaria TaxID=860376 RepID=A0A9P1IIV0_9PELO|nr:unnamed protein product [Caenorhabditis angaria]
MASQELFEELDKIAGNLDLEDIANALKRADEIDLKELEKSEICGILRRKGEWVYALSNYQEDKQQRYKHLEEAYEFALEGHKVDENDFECLKVLCSTAGRLAEESGIQKKIHYGFLFKSYLDKAIALNNNDFETLHMRGRFSYTVCQLSMIERLAAKVIGKIPETSNKEALEDLLRADQLVPGVAENQLFIGKTYMAMSDWKNAKKWLKIASENKTYVAVETEYVEEAIDLLQDKKLAKF